MDLNKDYYAILGIIPSADKETIKAVYRLLSKKYHPDTTKEDSDEADQKIRDITEAYSVLSDSSKRKKYDSERKPNNSSYEDFYEEETNDKGIYEELNADWKKAVSYYPDLEINRERLKSFSMDLGDTFRVYILKEKKFSNSGDVAYMLENVFLEKFFGQHKEIHDFAKMLLLGGKRKLARQLNNDIKFLGNEINPSHFLTSFCSQNNYKISNKQKAAEFISDSIWNVSRKKFVFFVAITLIFFWLLLVLAAIFQG